MGSPLRTPSNRRERRRGSKARASANFNIEKLERRFTEFHRDHPPQTRIPAPLRAAVLSAMRHGVTPGQLRRYCGLSSTQLEQWQQSGGEVPVGSVLEAQAPRVFSVVGDDPAQGPETTDSDAEQQLELRLDGWSISIRRVNR